ncbi:MAG: DUF4268 domain-containing protein [Solirubrobacteraceae bacterium]|nr:DUF4268 domain-containing protein [Solirubrobacteraceae bacterium]
MEADIKSVQDLFANQHRYVVPAYQRPYVWDEDRQWRPLWEDVERIADARLEEREARHFLGAIVIRRERTPPGGITEWSVIDGQQRLTTLQLLLVAMADAAREDGLAKDARQIGKLVHHDEDDAEGDERFKFWPTSANRDAFRQVAREGGPDAFHDDPTNSVHEAWIFFRHQAHEYAHADGAEGEESARRYAALREAVTGLLQIVTISLDREDPAQVIFETLNARGTPLLAIDLVKNALFDAAERAGASVDDIHDRYWAPQLGDDAYWSAEHRIGRLTVPRSETFLMHWLAMKLGEVIPADSLFELFRRRVLQAEGADPVRLVQELNADAATLRSFDGFAPGTHEHRFFGTLAKLDTTTMHPVALLLFRSGIDPTRRERALRAIESYLLRRMLRYLSTKNYSQLAARLISAANGDLARVDERIVDELLQSQADTSRWPTDDELREHLLHQPVYGWVKQSRVVMVLSEIELAARRGKVEQINTLPDKLQVEHIMPQAWQTHWALVDPTDEEAVRRRSDRVNRLGNLTLVAGALNASMSNGAWETKRDALAQHSLLLLNRELAQRDEWTEASIDARGAAMIDRIVELWPGPQAFMPRSWQPRDAESWPEDALTVPDAIRDIRAGATSYLATLLDDLAERPGGRRRFADVEAALGWPRRRLAAVLGGYQSRFGKPHDGRRPWRIHLDGDGTWWIWMDADQAAAVSDGVRAAGAGAERSERHERRLAFWTALIALAGARSALHAGVTPGEYSWVGASAGVRGLGLNYSVTKEGSSVELYIDRGRGADDENRAIFDTLHIQSAEIERMFGGPLSWEALDGRRACRIAHRLELGGWATDPTGWPEVHEAMVDAMTRLDEALRPHIAALAI